LVLQLYINACTSAFAAMSLVTVFWGARSVTLKGVLFMMFAAATVGQGFRIHFRENIFREKTSRSEAKKNPGFGRSAVVIIGYNYV
jgi:hypothetical protein